MKKRRSEKHGSLIFEILGLLLFFLAVGPSIVGLTRALTACKVWQAPTSAESTVPDDAMREATKDIPDYARPESNTYLTFPEWEIIYNTDEYAAFIANNPPSQFPYFNAVGQFWESYADVCLVVSDRYSVNGKLHYTLIVTGISFTAENMLKGAYEMTVGRAAEWASDGQPTEEEVYARKTAKEYADFLHGTPWYMFPFREKLQGLWNETGNSGPNMIRKWERKFALTLEYGSKMLYAGLIQFIVDSTHGTPDAPRIYLVTQGVTSDMANADLQVIKDIDGQRQVIDILRFDTFSKDVPALIDHGVQFIEIAGNDELLCTVIGPQDGEYDFQYGKYLFKLPLLTQPQQARIAFQVRVIDLHLFINELKSRPEIKLEHIYDY